MTDHRRSTTPLTSPVPIIDPERLYRLPLREVHAAAADVTSLPEIDLSIVTYNSQRWFEAYFASLAAQSYPLEKINLYVIDHSPDDICLTAMREAIAVIKSRFAAVTIEQRANRGFGAGHNRTLHLGKAAFALVTNIDLTYETGTLVSLVHRAMRDDYAAAWECRQKPYEHPKTYDILTGATAWVSSACVLLRRAAWQEVSGYDEHFFMYGEDVDLSFRLRDRGWILRYCPKTVVWHYTYDTPETIKEAQYYGSTLANILLRLRFGNWRDIIAGMFLQMALGGHRSGFTDGFYKQIANYGKLLRHMPYFALTRRKSREVFTFTRWDYAPHRDGAFYEHSEALSDLPLVTIIVRTYSGRLPLLEQALRSLNFQTYRPLEVIVVEDGGISAAKFVQDFRNQSTMDIVYYSAPKAGRSHTGNIGLELAGGSLIGFLDDDDLLFADHVEALVQALTVKPQINAAYAYSWEIETSFTHETWLPYTEGKPHRKFAQKFDRRLLWESNYIPIQAMLFRRDLYKRQGGFYEPLENLEDWDLWLRYSLEGDFLTIEKTTSIYRTPADPESRTRRMSMLAAHRERVLERQYGMIPVYSLGELKTMFGPMQAKVRGRIIDYLSRHPALYLKLRQLINALRQ